MEIIKTPLEGLLIIKPDVFEDERGYFFESYNKKKLKALGIDVNFVQDNHSMTIKKGTLRGLHFQNTPHTQSKLIHCTRGSVLDVVVDLRKYSLTYKKWVAVLLSAENKKQLFIPKGFAHGFLTLDDNTEFEYKVDNHQNKLSERVVRFNDPDIGIEWGNDNPLLLDRDKNAPLLKDCDVKL